MKNGKDIQINYGNWVSLKIIIISLGLFFIFSLLSLFISLANFSSESLRMFFLIPLLVLSTFTLVTAFYFTYSRYMFSYHGGKIQNKILELLISYIHWDGNGAVLDIGCGSGPLSIKIAQKYKTAKVTGIDYWGGMWEYSKKKCEGNAAAEGIHNRLTFLQASASSLPFKDDSFELVVSNLVFHEVKDTKNKQDVVKEALRVVKKGGNFVFQDLFLVNNTYGNIDNLLKTIKSWGIQEVQFVNTSNSQFIPTALKLPFMVGTIGIIYGIK